MKFVSCIVLLVALTYVFAIPGDTWSTVYYNVNGNSYSVHAGQDRENGVAWALYNNEMNSTGWARFNLETSPVFEDEIQAYGSGYLEGVVTAESIWQNWYNTLVDQFNNTEPSIYLKWFATNRVWMTTQIKMHAHSDHYWKHVQLVWLQLEGTLDGYNKAMSSDPSKQLDIDHLILLNADGDLETLQLLLGDEGLIPKTQQTRNAFSHCSSIVKVTTDLSELYAGHTTWSSFYEMLRVFKQYTLRYRAPQTTAATTLFSSYPGLLSSVDDFYQLDSSLVVIETTNGCYNMSLIHEKVVTSNILSWVRVIVANRMARSAEEWVKIFTKYNSGTYNNQWIVVDYNKFTPFQPLPDGTLWIAEQMPGSVTSKDVTPFLRLGYWPSFNVPFFQNVYDTCEFTNEEKTYGTWFTYDLSPRGEIFRRSANQITSLKDAANFLRYNDWENDPLSAGNPGNQISSRFDLVPANETFPNPDLDRAAFGGIDSKVTSRALLMIGSAYAQSGPTLGGAKQTLPPFDFNDWPELIHEGMPDVWDFPWVVMPQGNKVPVL